LNDSVGLSIGLVRKGGTVVLVWNLSPKVDLPLQKIVTGEIRILGSCAIRSEYGQVLDLLASGRLKVDDQMVAVALLEEGEEWFRKLSQKQIPPGKIILIP
jgi:L-iditol 2-dehydrogenase